jgi:2-oxo-3-hexenedioate decarboxylase
MDQLLISAIAADLANTFGHGRRQLRITDQYPEFSLDDAYAVASGVRAIRESRGEIAIGRKIGATNVAVWKLLNVTGPLWNFVFDTTNRSLPGGRGFFQIGDFGLPRIEPEIVLELRRVPRVDMDDVALLECVGRMCHGFELVHSPFPQWSMGGPDATAAYGVHMALLTGPWLELSGERKPWIDMLREFSVTLRCSDGRTRHGVGRNVLGSPLNALRFLVKDLSLHPERGVLHCGEIVSTGTLTEAMPIWRGQTWSTTIRGAPFEGLSLTLT